MTDHEYGRPLSDYTISLTLDAEAVEAERLLRAALQAQGFGILSEIDVQATLREKLGEDIGTYRILGACNPSLAKRALDADRDVGALLPCNVVVRANPAGGTDICAADPAAMLELGAAGLRDVAADARKALDAALTALVEGSVTSGPPATREAAR
jgi:uncharacterized protein (DUF302 family)